MNILFQVTSQTLQEFTNIQKLFERLQRLSHHSSAFLDRSHDTRFALLYSDATLPPEKRCLNVQITMFSIHYRINLPRSVY